MPLKKELMSFLERRRPVTPQQGQGDSQVRSEAGVRRRQRPFFKEERM
jgi:hypothetical protein